MLDELVRQRQPRGGIAGVKGKVHEGRFRTHEITEQHGDVDAVKCAEGLLPRCWRVILVEVVAIQIAGAAGQAQQPDHIVDRQIERIADHVMGRRVDGLIFWLDQIVEGYS